MSIKSIIYTEYIDLDYNIKNIKVKIFFDENFKNFLLENKEYKKYLKRKIYKNSMTYTYNKKMRKQKEQKEQNTEKNISHSQWVCFDALKQLSEKLEKRMYEISIPISRDFYNNCKNYTHLLMICNSLESEYDKCVCEYLIKHQTEEFIFEKQIKIFEN